MRLILFLTAVLLFPAVALSQTTYHVPDDFSTIQSAIDGCANGDTVIIRPGTYIENIDFKRKAIHLKSESGPEVTIIDGRNPTDPDLGSVVLFNRFEGPDSILEGFTLTNGTGTLIEGWGWYTYAGGGILCKGTSPTIIDNIIIKNEPDGLGGGIACWVGFGSCSPTIRGNIISENDGSGIYCRDASPVITDNVILHNTGCGISCEQDSSPTIDGNVISRNNSSGIHCMSGSPVITNNTISGHFLLNTEGAGIYSGASARIVGNTIFGNEAWNGGGIHGSASIVAKNVIVHNTARANGGGIHTYSSGTIAANIIAHNSAYEFGGGIYCGSNSPVLVNNTISDNTAVFGGGMFCAGGWPTVTNTILWNNTAQIDPEIHVAAGLLVVSYSDVKGGWPGTGNIDADPLCLDPALDDYHLTWQSPCKDTGDNASVPGALKDDFEDDPRIVDGTVDMGADEFHNHLYHRGDVIPGGDIDFCVVGEPGDPPLLGAGDGIQDPPKTTQYGDLYLTLPLAGRWNLPNIPGNGVLVFPAKVPVNWIPWEDHPFQALLGPLGNPDSVLTNLIVLEAIQESPVTVYVPDDKPTIQEAIDFVAEGSTVIVRPGTYVENIDFRGKAITVKSEQGADVTVIDGNQADSVVVFQELQDVNSVLDGFTITNGSAIRGGGILCRYSSPTITNNIITNNIAPHTGQGGGINCFRGSPTITNNIILNNKASDGGGIYCYYAHSPTIANNTISLNTAGAAGGGLYCYYSSPIVTNTILWDNIAPTGPEIDHHSGSPVVNYCDVTGGWSGTGNIDAAPLFVTGPMGGYYLSQIAAGQGQDSPCVDTGDPGSTMIDGTTRTDEVQDAGVVDMGYHYPLP